MAAFCGSFRLDETTSSSSSLRRIGRSNSSLVSSEFTTSDVARIAGYQKLSQSMRFVSDECSTSNITDRRSRSNKAWTSFLRVLSFKKVGNRNSEKRETAVEKAAAGPATLGERKKIVRSAWLPDRHRRWPVQGW